MSSTLKQLINTMSERKYPHHGHVLGPLCTIGAGDSARCDVILQALGGTLRWECSGVGFVLSKTEDVDLFALCPRNDNNVHPVRAKSNLFDQANTPFEYTDLLEVLGVKQHNKTIGPRGQGVLSRLRLMKVTLLPRPSGAAPWRSRRQRNYTARSALSSTPSSSRPNRTAPASLDPPSSTPSSSKDVSAVPTHQQKPLPNIRHPSPSLTKQLPRVSPDRKSVV